MSAVALPKHPRTHHVRAFDERDYDAIVEIANRCFPEYPETVDEWRFNDARRDPKLHHERRIAEDDTGRVVAFGTLNHLSWSYNPHRLWLDINVDPDHRNEGIGATLYDDLRAKAAAFQPERLLAGAREDFPISRGFLERRGFREGMREWENHLQLADYDPAAWQGRISAVEAGGVRIATLSELQSDPQWEDKLYACCEACSADVPSTESHTPADRDTWIKRVRDNPNMIAEAFAIAVDEAAGTYVGVSNLWRQQAAPEELHTGLTGVRREFRRKGVATAMKLRSLRWAKEEGFRLVKTWNATGNEGMLAINDALGFQRQPAWIDYVVDLDETGAPRQVSEEKAGPSA